MIKHFCNNSDLNGFLQERFLKRKKEKKEAKWPDHRGMEFSREVIMKWMTGAQPKEASGGEPGAALLWAGVWGRLWGCQVNRKSFIKNQQ